MGYLFELVFAVGFLGLGAMALFFFLRVLLLTWMVQIVGNVVHGVLRLIKSILHASIFVFGPAVLGAFIVGLGLQIGLNLDASGGNSSADPTMPVLIAFLAFFVIVALRGWQWKARRHHQNASVQKAVEADDVIEAPEQANYPAGYELITDAWSRAIKLAPERRNDLLNARTACAELLNAVELHESVPDFAMTETAMLIRNHLTALVDSSERRLRGARPSERKLIVEEMVEFLLGFAQRAQQDMSVAGPSLDEKDSAMRAHLYSQLFG
jgi:hypothetical protein